MIVEMVHSSNFWLNMFPAHDRVSNVLSPRCIMTGQTCDYKLHCMAQLGEYVQVHEDHDNSMVARTSGAIALRPTGNVQGGYFFMSLTTGRRLNRNNWTALPMPGEVVERVHLLSRRNPAGSDIIFGWRDGTPIDDLPDDVDDMHDEDYDPDTDSEASDASDHDDSDNNDDDNPPPLVARVNYADDDDDDSHDSNDDDSSGNEDDNDSDEAYSDDDSMEGPDDGPKLEMAATAGVPTAGVDNASPEGVNQAGVATRANPGVAQPPTDVSEEMDSKYGARQRSGLRARRVPVPPSILKEPRSSAHRAREHEEETLNAMLCNELNGRKGFFDIEEIALTQYGLKKGLERYGEAASNAVLKEMRQLHDRGTIKPKHATELTPEERKKSLAYLMFIKEKRCGTIKGRGCADGRKQRLYKTKEETSSPTVRTESLLLSCVIDAHERRHVMTCDVPGAFMQVDVDEVVHVRLAGALAELLTKVDPELYAKYVSMERGKPVLYVQLLKALYGTLSAALLFWKDLSQHLHEQGYRPNPYDSCVMNRMVNGKQSTVLWHVDDLKISHADGQQNEILLTKLNEWYGNESPLTVTRGDIHEYLGMTIDYSTDGKVHIRMDDYVDKLLDEVGSSMEGRAATPAAEHQFKVNDQATKLGEEDSDFLHSTTAKLLFLCKRARPDIQTPVAFLCTRVSCSDIDDYKKLRRVVCYLRCTRGMCLTLEAHDLQIIKWWVDASFAVHHDMRSHTGATMSLGKGAVCSASIRQKINTRSSTSAELVGVDDAMPMILWTRQFMEGQGYIIKDNILYQDNQSAMLLEINGQKSSTKRTRHMNIRYFFVTDQVRAKKLTVEYCPTGDMLADVFTKPLQGAAFVKFRKSILNL